MRQIVFRIPVPGFADGIPIYGYGLMLFVAFLLCTWLACRRARREGIASGHIQDLAIWLFVGGLVVSRAVYLIQAPNVDGFWDFVTQFPRIWDGGVILYGAVIGGLLGYVLAYFFIVRKHGLSGWKIADIAAPSIALGLALGRVGCLLNGCCYGHVACPHCPGISFPLSAPSRFALVDAGYQSAAGFTMVTAEDDPRTVASVQPDSPAGKAGLRPGDVIVAVNGKPAGKSHDDVRKRIREEATDAAGPTLTVERAGERRGLGPAVGLSPADFQMIDDRVIKAVMPGSAAAEAGLGKWDQIRTIDGREVEEYPALTRYLGDPHHWPRGKAELTLTVVKPDSTEQVVEFVPWTLRLHPTQVYESVSMVLLFLLLTAYYPFRRHYGEVVALLMVCYAAHRYLNELLRNDVRPEGFEKYASILLFGAGIAIFIWLRWLRRQPAAYPVPAAAR
jgi:prolipoprotein diacylglyceryltransferase